MSDTETRLQVEENHHKACSRIQELENELRSCDQYAKQQYAFYEEELILADEIVRLLKVHFTDYSQGLSDTIRIYESMRGKR